MPELLERDSRWGENAADDMSAASSTPPTRGRVLFFLPSLQGGGAERAVVNLLKCLDKRTFPPLLVLKRKEGVLLEDVPSDVEVVELDQEYKGILVSSWLLWKTIRKVRPDLVVSFLNQCNVCAILAGMFRRRNYRLIISVRNNLGAKFSNRSWAKRVLKEMFVSKMYGRADHIVSVSDGVAHELVERFKLPKAMITTVHNPLDIERIQRKSEAHAPVREWAGSDRVIVGAGRLVPQKGFSDLIEVLSIVRKSISAKLILLGDGPLKKDLQSQADALGLDNEVLFPGFVENPWSWISRSDVFVLSSHWEGLPAVLIEAMACGTPVVATDCDFGPREYVEPGVNGLLVPPGNTTQLAEAIVKVLQDPQLAAQFVKNGSERATHFESPEACRRFERLFERITESGE